jgi:hypothetical protein
VGKGTLASVLEGEWAETITEALQGASIPYVITLHVPGGEVPGENPWDPPVVVDPVDHPGEGWRDSYTADMIDGSTILSTDVRIMVLASSLASYVPFVGQSITVDGTTYSIIHVARDPAHALYDLQART